MPVPSAGGDRAYTGVTAVDRARFNLWYRVSPGVVGGRLSLGAAAADGQDNSFGRLPGFRRTWSRRSPVPGITPVGDRAVLARLDELDKEQDVLPAREYPPQCGALRWIPEMLVITHSGMICAWPDAWPK